MKKLDAKGHVPIDWFDVERLALISFRGTRQMTHAEMTYMEHAWKTDPDEYKRRTEAVRKAERDRISMRR